ncbi:MAG: hypothetical protein V2I36_09505, partial [Desulfopila sp.]|nr:hypothetical protein [Desulfopila sp.]
NIGKVFFYDRKLLSVKRKRKKKKGTNLFFAIAKEYCPFERLAKATDGEGNVTTYTYESSDSCASCSCNSDLVAEISYHTFIMTFKYDSMKRLIRQTHLLADEYRTTTLYL